MTSIEIADRNRLPEALAPYPETHVYLRLLSFSSLIYSPTTTRIPLFLSHLTDSSRRSCGTTLLARPQQRRHSCGSVRLRRKLSFHPPLSMCTIHHSCAATPASSHISHSSHYSCYIHWGATSKSHPESIPRQWNRVQDAAVTAPCTTSECPSP